jgi:signal transduction histidine kinase
MRWRHWLLACLTAWAGLVVLGVPLLSAGPQRALTGGLLGAGAVVSAAVAALLARWAARPVQELADAAGRLSTGDPRPVGHRYGVAELDQIADGLDSASRRVTALLTADRELATDASHQLRTPLTALSMRLEEMIAAADDPVAVREEGTAALEQTEHLSEVVTQLLGPARRAAGGTAELTAVDTIIDQQVREWEPAYRRARRRLIVTGQAGLQAHVTPGGLSQVLATLLDNALMHGAGTVIIRRSVSPRSVVIEVEDQGRGVPPELVARIFERSVSGRPEGTGLGLSLARTMAAADGGRVILARPSPPIFAVFLPRDAPEDRPPRKGPA